jgi:hypothetical protein
MNLLMGSAFGTETGRKPAGGEIAESIQERAGQNGEKIDTAVHRFKGLAIR